MDSLHLDYKQVLDEIPYRNLVIMSKDKARIAYEGVKREVSERDFFKGNIKFDE